MKRALAIGLGGVCVGLLAAIMVACGGGNQERTPIGTGSTAVTPGGSHDPSKWPADDRTRCDWRGKPELEVAETAGPGALKPNVRRVYKMEGEGDSRHKTLVCREIDTNLDGIKDVVRTFNAKGEAVKEESDRDYDGKSDVWLTFVDGRIAEEDLDTNHDGQPDVWKFYLDGQLNRIRRDRNFDGKPDVWEIYTKGHLERVGVDDSFDGHVDRWDRDEAMKYAQEQAEKKALAAMDAGPGSDTSTDAGSSGGADAGAPKRKNK
jgi:hypothetical protein